MKRDLDAIDASLGGRRVDAPRGELAALVHALRDERPEPAPEFRARLDADMAERLRTRTTPGRAGAALAGLRAHGSRRTWLATTGAAASVVLVVLVVSSLSGGRPGGGPVESLTAPVSQSQSGAPAARSADGAGAAATAAPSGASAEPLAANRGRRVEREALLTLAAPASRIGDISDKVIAVTDQVGGIVVSSSISSSDSGQGGAQFQLSVPSARLDDALARLSRLAHVRSRQQNGQDVTGQFVSAGDRLRVSVAERDGLLRQLASAGTPNATASIRARLRIVQSQIASDRGELNRLRHRTDRSLISVDVEPGTAGGGGGAYTPRDALRDAGRILSAAVAVALVSLAVAVPFVLLLGLAGALMRSARRRRRDQALESC